MSSGGTFEYNGRRTGNKAIISPDGSHRDKKYKARLLNDSSSITKSLLASFVKVVRFVPAKGFGRERLFNCTRMRKTESVHYIAWFNIMLAYQLGTMCLVLKPRLVNNTRYSFA